MARPDSGITKELMTALMVRMLTSPSVPMPMQTPDLEDEVSLARYPFLPQAVPWIAQLASANGIDLDVLLDGGALELSRRRGRMRLIDTVDSDEGVEAAAMGDIHTENGRVLEAFSYYYARLVICASEDERLISRWAQAEAARAERLLAVDLDNLPVVAETYISQIRLKENGLWQIGLKDFIEICPSISGARWRLPNCDVKDGWVTLHEERTYSSSSKLARLLRERIKRTIQSGAIVKMADINTDLAMRLAEPVGMVVGLVAARQSDAIEISSAGKEDWPPCMRGVIGQLADAVNVNHYGRVFLGAISRTVGLPRENCVDFFRAAPDFSESVTTYQVGHLYDHEYTPSGCSKLKLNHNCPVLKGDDSLCDQIWMDHPLKYVRAKQRRRKQQAVNEEVVESNSAPDD